MAKKYTAEFKREAVRMMTTGGLSVPEVAAKLGVNASQLYHWRKVAKSQGQAAFPGSGHLSPTEEENRKLRIDNKQLLAERDLLKKVLAFFACQAK